MPENDKVFTALEFIDELMGWADRNLQTMIPTALFPAFREVIVKHGKLSFSASVPLDINGNKKNRKSRKQL